MVIVPGTDRFGFRVVSEKGLEVTPFAVAEKSAEVIETKRDTGNRAFLTRRPQSARRLREEVGPSMLWENGRRIEAPFGARGKLGKQGRPGEAHGIQRAYMEDLGTEKSAETTQRIVLHLYDILNSK